MSVFNFSYIPVFYDGILEEKKTIRLKSWQLLTDYIFKEKSHFAKAKILLHQYFKSLWQVHDSWSKVDNLITEVVPTKSISN